MLPQSTAVWDTSAVLSDRSVLGGFVGGFLFEGLRVALGDRLDVSNSQATAAGNVVVAVGGAAAHVRLPAVQRLAGLFLSGGGGLLRGLDMRLAQECEVPVHLTEQPLATVVLGAGRLLDYEPEQREAFLALTRR